MLSRMATVYNNSMANQFLALSLFVVLLSFFIVLNSISTFEIARARPVLESLGQAFKTDKADPLYGLSEISPVPEAMDYAKSMAGRGGALQRIEGLFSSQIQGIAVKQDRLGTEMAIRLPFEDFAVRINEELTPGTKTDERFLPMLVSILDAQEEAQKQGASAYRMDMVLETPGKPYAALSSGDKKIHALSAIARRLEEAGIPTNLVGIGLSPGEDGMLTLYFRRHEPFNPVEGGGP